MISILLVSGSGREGSTNAAVLRTAAQVASPDVEAVSFAGLGELPLFNPDDDREGGRVDTRVADMRRHMADADAVLICTPEYAGALPAALKNLLEWTIGDAGTYGKPVGWINAAGPAAPTGAADAHDSLRKVLTYAGADIVDEACARIPVSRDMLGGDGLIADEPTRAEIAATVERLADRVRLGGDG
jgi:chromate reductase, NAD(P)H dehydrogenase (quinone)